MKKIIGIVLVGFGILNFIMGIVLTSETTAVAKGKPTQMIITGIVFLLTGAALIKSANAKKES